MQTIGGRAVYLGDMPAACWLDTKVELKLGRVFSGSPTLPRQRSQSQNIDKEQLDKKSRHLLVRVVAVAARRSLGAESPSDPEPYRAE